MKNALLTALCLMIWQIASGQMPSIQEILKAQNEAKNQVQLRDADVYVVDSVYCYQFSLTFFMYNGCIKIKCCVFNRYS